MMVETSFIPVVMSDDAIQTTYKVFALKAQEFIVCGSSAQLAQFAGIHIAYVSVLVRSKMNVCSNQCVHETHVKTRMAFFQNQYSNGFLKSVAKGKNQHGRPFTENKVSYFS